MNNTLPSKRKEESGSCVAQFNLQRHLEYQNPPSLSQPVHCHAAYDKPTDSLSG